MEKFKSDNIFSSSGALESFNGVKMLVDLLQENVDEVVGCLEKSICLFACFFFSYNVWSALFNIL